MDYIQNCQRKWKEHVNRINTGRIKKKNRVISQEDEDKSDVQRRTEIVTGYLV